MALRSCGSVACPAIGDAVVAKPAHAVCLMHRIIRFCCRCAPDRGQPRSYKGFVSSAELVGVSLLAIGDAVVVNRGCAVCLVNRVIRFCCRFAPDRGQATLLQGICSVARICVERRTCGSELARDRRRSRREPGPCGLPDVPRHPILLPLRARSRASHAPTRDLLALRSCGSVACPAIGDAVVVKPTHAVCLMYRVQDKALLQKNAP